MNVLCGRQFANMLHALSLVIRTALQLRYSPARVIVSMKKRSIREQKVSAVMNGREGLGLVLSNRYADAAVCGGMSLVSFQILSRDKSPHNNH